MPAKINPERCRIDPFANDLPVLLIGRARLREPAYFDDFPSLISGRWQSRRSEKDDAPVFASELTSLAKSNFPRSERRSHGSDFASKNSFSSAPFSSSNAPRVRIS